MKNWHEGVKLFSGFINMWTSPSSQPIPTLAADPGVQKTVANSSLPAPITEAARRQLPSPTRPGGADSQRYLKRSFDQVQRDKPSLLPIAIADIKCEDNLKIVTNSIENLHDFERRSKALAELTENLEKIPKKMLEKTVGMMAKVLIGLPVDATSTPTISMINAISRTGNQEVRGNYLGLLVPTIIAAEPEARKKMIDCLIRALPHIAPGADRAKATEQITLLLMHDSDVVAGDHLTTLVQQTHHFAPGNDLNVPLGIIVWFATKRLSEAQRCKIFMEVALRRRALIPIDDFIDQLEEVAQFARKPSDVCARLEKQNEIFKALANEFKNWPVNSNFKAAVVIIGREMQSAPSNLQKDLACFVGKGLREVAFKLEERLKGDPHSEHTAEHAMSVHAWLQAVAVSPRSAREELMEAASGLVESAWAAGHLFRLHMLESYGTVFFGAEKNKLVDKLKFKNLMR